VADPKQAVLAEVPAFNVRVHEIRAGAEGGPFAVAGENLVAGRVVSHVKAFDGTGRELWSMPADDGGSTVAMDPLARFINLHSSRQLLEVATGKVAAAWQWARSRALSPGARFAAGSQSSTARGVVLHRRADEKTVVILGLDTLVSGQTQVFSEDGRYLVWGSHEGTVLVADLIEVQERLAGVGMGW
jgi:hypothetical protein